MAENFLLRPWHIDDLHDLVRNANNLNIAKYMTDGFPHPYSLDDGRKFIEYALSDQPIHIFAIELDQKACGGIGIHRQSGIHRKNAELGYWLGQDYWGRGIVTEAVKQMVNFAFKTYDINRVFARPFSNNPASQRVLEKAGFLLEAKLQKSIFKNGQYLDELIFAIIHL